MIKCPNCGKPAGANIIDTEVYIWHDIVSVYITYRCECGRGFITRAQIDKANEEMYEEEI